MLEAYEAPTIASHLPGLANKFGRSRRGSFLGEIDGVSVQQLLADHGSPLFVFSETTLRRTFSEARRAFELRYPKVRFGWSYKTNYLDAICRIFHQEGAWAEVVSEHEYEMARRLDVPGDKIIFNGPYKPRDAMEKAMAEGSLINLNGLDELYQAEQIATGLGRVIDVGMRLNMDTGLTPTWSRFGFSLDSGEAWTALQRIHLGGKLRLTSLHSHIGTFVLDPRAYGVQVEKMAAFARRAASLGYTIENIDVGGGFASRNTLHQQYAPGEEANPSFDSYAEAISGALIKADFATESPPTLVLETGRALVDEAGTLLTTVIGNGRLPSGQRSTVVDAGVNLLFTSFWYKHKVQPTREFHGRLEETVLYGPLCMNIDCLRPSVHLPVMQTGESLAISPVGAYNVTQWMQFIRMRPAVVLIGREGEVCRIREAETINALKDHEHLPEWLR